MKKSMFAKLSLFLLLSSIVTFLFSRSEEEPGVPRSHWTDILHSLRPPSYQGKPTAFWRKEIAICDEQLFSDVPYPLGRNGDPAALPVLIDMLRAEHWKIRMLALRCIKILERRAEGAVPHLIGATYDENLRVRMEAIDALAAVGSKRNSVLARLRELSHDSDMFIRLKVAAAYWRLGGDPLVAIDVYMQALSDPEVDEGFSRDYIYRQLGEIGPVSEKVVPALIGGIEGHGPRWTSIDALKALEKIGPNAAQAGPALKARLTCSNRLERVWAARAYWKVSGDTERASSVLRRLARDPEGEDDTMVRCLALESITELGLNHKEVVALIDDLMVDEDIGVRAMAARAHWRKERQAAVVLPIFIEALQANPIISYKEEIVDVLGELQEEAKPAFPLLVERANDPDFTWQQRAKVIKVMMKIDPERTKKMNFELP